MSCAQRSRFPELCAKIFVWYVYIAKCVDGTYYVGCTSNVDERIKRHPKGEVYYTSTRLPIEIIATMAFKNRYKAYEFEKYLKSGSGRAFMFKRII
jgi:putative endonuclease